MVSGSLESTMDAMDARRGATGDPRQTVPGGHRGTSAGSIVPRREHPGNPHGVPWPLSRKTGKWPSILRGICISEFIDEFLRTNLILTCYCHLYFLWAFMSLIPGISLVTRWGPEVSEPLGDRELWGGQKLGSLEMALKAGPKCSIGRLHELCHILLQ